MILHEAQAWRDTWLRCVSGAKEGLRWGSGHSPCYTTGLACWRHWVPVHRFAEQSNRMSRTGWEPHGSPHLFHVKGDNEFQGGDGGEERGEEGSNPANGLPIHDTQDVVWDGKFLLSPALDQLWGCTVGHQEPANKLDTFLPDPTSAPKATEPYPPTNIISKVSLRERECVCVLYVCAYRYVNLPAEAREWHQMPPSDVLHHMSWGRLSYWAWSLLTGLKELVIEPQVPWYPSISNSTMLGLRAQAATLGFYIGAGVMEIWIQVLVFVRQVLLLTEWIISSAQCSFFIKKMYLCMFLCVYVLMRVDVQ